ncbi:MAG: GNAT family N-acetyltransferase [Nitrospirae bacterium]|nr:GNAT family N-acetyltransferase [Nitrospirota bacterium]
MEVTIRPARTDDISGMCALLTELFSIEADFKPDPGKQTRGLGCMINDPSGGSLLLVAESGSAVVGMATVQTLISTAEGGRVGLVEDVVVAREHRGKGIGSRLLEYVMKWAQERKLKRLQLLADKDNLPALAFYSGLRWEKTGLICLRKMA